MVRWFYTLPLRLRTVLRRDRVERDLNDEFDFHVEMQTKENVARGMSKREARLAARRQFGGLAQRQEECRDTRRLGWLEDLWQDLRHARRTLAKSPGFAIVAILSLGLGIGASTVLFSVVDAVLFKPLPLPEADRLVYLDEFKEKQPSGGNPMRLADWQKARSFSAVAGMYGEDLVLKSQGEPERVLTLRTLGPLLSGLRLRPVVGRLPTPDEERGRGAPVVVISHRLWQRLFAANSNTLGRTLSLSGTVYTLIGVLAPEMEYPVRFDAWAPAPDSTYKIARQAAFLGQVARLQDGVSLANAQTELDALAPALAHQYPDTDKGLSALLVPVQELMTSGARVPLLMLFATMLAVLLVACMNVAGLQLARGLARQREAAIRIALGAGPGRLARLFLSESLLLALAGGAAGIALASFSLEVVKHLLPDELPRLASAAIDARVLLFGVAIALVSAVVCGLLPAIQAARTAAARPMKEGGARIGGGRHHLRSILVVTEVAVSVVLLIGAALLATSFVRMRQAQLGFSPEQTLTFGVDFSWQTPENRLESFSHELLQRLEAIPGVRAAGVTDRLPLEGGSATARAAIKGRELSPALAGQVVSWRTASPGFFAAAGIALRAGDLYSQPAARSSAKGAVINETFARLYFAGRDPIGEELTLLSKGQAPDAGATWYRVAGVVADVPQEIGRPVLPEVFRAWGEDYWPLMNFAVRAHGDPRLLASAAREAVRSVDPDQMLRDLGPMQSRVSEAVAAPRTRAWITTAFAGTALLLAAIGLYGLLASEVARRRQEFGVRLALGAEPRTILLSALGRGLTLAATGLAIGAGASFALTGLLGSLLYGVPPHDLPALALSALLLLAVAALACLVPARRASRTDPDRRVTAGITGVWHSRRATADNNPT